MQFNDRTEDFEKLTRRPWHVSGKRLQWKVNWCNDGSSSSSGDRWVDAHGSLNTNKPNPFFFRTCGTRTGNWIANDRLVTNWQPEWQVVSWWRADRGQMKKRREPVMSHVTGTFVSVFTSMSDHVSPGHVSRPPQLISVGRVCPTFCFPLKRTSPVVQHGRTASPNDTKYGSSCEAYVFIVLITSTRK